MKGLIAGIILFLFIVSFVFAAIYENIRGSSKNDDSNEPFSDDYY